MTLYTSFFFLLFYEKDCTFLGRKGEVRSLFSLLPRGKSFYETLEKERLSRGVNLSLLTLLYIDI